MNNLKIEIYEIARKVHANNFPAYMAAKDAYHAGKISDADFLAARAHNDALKAACDKAEADLVAG